MSAEHIENNKIDQHAFGSRIKTAMAEGQAGRREIASRLARLPLEHLVKVPPSSFAMLGPEGLEMLMSMRRDIPAGMMAEPSTVAQLASSKSATAPWKERRRWPTWAVCGVLLAAGPVFDRTWPLLERMAGNSARPVQVSTWPPCRRLDRYVDGCLYRTGYPQTTLRQLADPLGISANELALSNRHIAANVDAPLARGTSIVVWRGTATLYRLEAR